jgi:hypothetical protein
MQGSRVVVVFAVLAAIVFVFAIALLVYRSEGAALNWHMGDSDPVLIFYPSGDDLYVISASNVSLVNEAGKAQWTTPFASTQYSTMGSDGLLYLYSADRGLNVVYPNGTLNLISHADIDRPPVVGDDGSIYLRSWSQLSAMDASGMELWNTSSVISDPVVDSQGYVYFFTRPPDNITDVFLDCMSPDGTMRWSIFYDKFDGGTALKPAKADGVFVYDELTGAFSHMDRYGNVTWDHSMTYLGQYDLVGDEKDRIYLFYLWGTVHVIDQRGNLLSKFNPVVTYNVNLTYVPAVYNDTTYAIGDGKYPDTAVLYALNLNGSLKWKREINSSIAPNIYTGKDIVCIDTEVNAGRQLVPKLYVLSDTGDLKYTYNLGDGHRWEQVYVNRNDTVFARTYGDILYALKG